MSLGTTDISTTLVGNEIGYPIVDIGGNSVSRDIGGMCTYTGVNKWSKYKPISYTSSGMTMTQFLTALQGQNFGLTLPTGTLSSLSSTVSGAWPYVRPAGGSSSPYRLGDFRSYDDLSQPPFWMETYPTGVTLNTATFGFNRNMSTDSPLHGLLLSDILSGSWYFGIALFWGSYSAFITTSTTIDNTTKDSLVADFGSSPFTGTIGGEQSATWVAFACDTAFTTWQTDFGQLANIVVFPDREYACEYPSSFSSKGDFTMQIPYMTVNGVTTSPQSLTLTGTGSQDVGIVTYPTAGTWDFSFSPTNIQISGTKTSNTILTLNYDITTATTTTLTITYTDSYTVSSIQINLTLNP